MGEENLLSQDDFTMQLTILHPNPRFEREWLVCDLDDPSSSWPVAIATIPTMSCKAYPKFIFGLVMAAPI